MVLDTETVAVLTGLILLWRKSPFPLDIFLHRLELFLCRPLTCKMQEPSLSVMGINVQRMSDTLSGVRNFDSGH